MFLLMCMAMVCRTTWWKVLAFLNWLFLMHKIWDIAMDQRDVELWLTDTNLEVEFTNISMMREYMIIGYVILCIVH